MPRGARLLGPPRVWHGGGWHDLLLDKRLAMLTFLTCAGSWVSRDRLAFLFWPDASSRSARINLRQLVARTRALPLEPQVEGDDARLTWNAPSDVRSFRAAAARGAWRTAERLYGGELAEGLEVESPEYSDWLESERADLREAYRFAALRCAELAESESRNDLAMALYHRLLRLDPLDEYAATSLVRLHITRGDLDEARRVLKAYAVRWERAMDAPLDERLVSRLSGGVDAPDGDLDHPA